MSELLTCYKQTTLGVLTQSFIVKLLFLQPPEQSPEVSPPGPGPGPGPVLPVNMSDTLCVL